MLPWKERKKKFSRTTVDLLRREKQELVEYCSASDQKQSEFITKAIAEKLEREKHR